MKRPPALFSALIGIALACIPCVAGAAKLSKDEALRQLETNRKLLTRFEAEYALLKQFERDPSPSVRGEVGDLRTKIEALKDDIGRLTANLDESEKADEFLKDVIAESAATGSKRRPPGTARPTRSLHEKALKLVAERRLDEAAAVYQDIILADPNDDQAYLILGHVRLLSGDYDKAEDAFKNAVDIDPANIDEIVPFYRNLVLQAPRDDQAEANLGYAYLMVGDAVRAGEAFRAALEIRPSNESARKGLEIARSFA